jgi:hypothetical protein
VLLPATIIDYFDRHGAAVSFFTALLLAALTGAYVVLTARLAKSQEHATRASTEPVVVPQVEFVDGTVRLTLRNASTAVASGVRAYTGNGSIATIRERPSDLTLFPGENAHFHLDLPDDDQATALTVLWGGVETLYADAHETTLFRTRIFITEFTNAPQPSDLVVQVGIARERHKRKALIKQSAVQHTANHQDPRETWPLSALWIAANEPIEGLVYGHA